MKSVIQSENWWPLLLRALDLLARPTAHNLLQGFEAWDYNLRLRPCLKQLERARFLASRGSGRDRRLHATPEGRLAAVGGVDPARRWERPWDRRWRLLMFDLPSRNQTLRLRLWRWLRRSRFGYLQHSVWLSPDPVTDENLPLRRLMLTPETFVVIEGRPTGSDTDEDLIQSAWDFTAINRRYQRVCELAERGRKLARCGNAKPAEVHGWLAENQLAWLNAVDSDPLLPELLLPKDYLGHEAWEQRNATLDALARLELVPSV
ncbi:MAG TPA: PaaX family transcriptional regulator C-terminal domain-containing protein [Verrucomicrobiae bacterium]|nr:PaaX family transcriptional regulator C-terminal domain-containing protein [Verrucomicrobiae bacterium]